MCPSPSLSKLSAPPSNGSRSSNPSNFGFANPKFDGLDERDPLLGGRGPTSTGLATDTFAQPQGSGLNRRITGLADFITVRGGAYFFMPGISAIL